MTLLPLTWLPKVVVEPDDEPLLAPASPEPEEVVATAGAGVSMRAALATTEEVVVTAGAGVLMRATLATTEVVGVLEKPPNESNVEKLLSIKEGIGLASSSDWAFSERSGLMMDMAVSPDACALVTGHLRPT
ncbi:hypothetical protein WCLP8_5100007 [uncultured Gammaproteobacteria bacterium]